MVNHDHDRKSPSDDSTMDAFIYEHGIVLPIPDTMDSTVAIPVLIFNCALCHQLLARHWNDRSASCNFLERAKDLYKLAYDQQDADENVIFKFAIANNIGVIHKKLGNYEESSRCFEHLVSLMMFYIDVGAEESKHLQPVHGFWKNVLGNGSIAPAA